jgi:hypothetical protein
MEPSDQNDISKEDSSNNSAEPTLAPNERSKVALAVAMMTLSAVNIALQPPASNLTQVTSRKPVLENIIAEATTDLSASRDKRAVDQLLAQNFENYARNFENYARNFENYARNFENYGRDFDHPSIKSRRLSLARAIVGGKPSQLPNGQRVPDSVDRLLSGGVKAS